jgi:hypothetical protein
MRALALALARTLTLKLAPTLARTLTLKLAPTLARTPASSSPAALRAR